MYKSLIKPILFRFNPEAVHDFAVSLGEFAGRFAPTRFITRLIYGYNGPDISKVVDGIKYKTPIILSAGFDNNARLTRILPMLSFGGEEIGSVTLRPCEGNPYPRLTRLPSTQSIIVNKGLRNIGAEAIIKKLQNTPRVKNFVLGISLARTNDVASSSVEDGILDYCQSLKKFTESGVGDYFTINISCPNAFTGELFTKPPLLEQLLNALDKVERIKPLYIKMPISINSEVFLDLLSVIEHHKVDGVVIGNLEKNYDVIDPKDIKPTQFQGGISGRPCFKRSNELIALTKKKYKNRFTIIGSGGIFSHADAREKMKLGADLVQLITGMIYEGPGLIKNICRCSSVGRASLS
jgi:dihydroorotate dehydrogenase